MTRKSMISTLFIGGAFLAGTVALIARPVVAKSAGPAKGFDAEIAHYAQTMMEDEVGVDSFQADRSPTKSYRTAPLAGLWSHAKGGFYHDGRFATLADVVEHYNTFLKLNLNADEKADLVEHLKSL
jgi:hypothetical protein